MWESRRGTGLPLVLMASPTPHPCATSHSQVPLRAGAVPLAAGHFPKEMLLHGIAGSRVGSSQTRLGGYQGGQTRELEAQGDSWEPGKVPALPAMPTPFLYGVQCGLDVGICGRSRTEATVWDGEGRCQDGRSQLPAKAW